MVTKSPVYVEEAPPISGSISDGVKPKPKPRTSVGSSPCPPTDINSFKEQSGGI